MPTFKPGDDLSFLDEVPHWEGATLAKKETVLEVQGVYEKVPFGSYYFIPADFNREQGPFTHISRRTCEGVSYADGKFKGNDTVWARDPNISISWNIDPNRTDYPTIYTDLDHISSTRIEMAKPLNYANLRKSIVKDFNECPKKYLKIKELFLMEVNLDFLDLWNLLMKEFL